MKCLVFVASSALNPNSQPMYRISPTGYRNTKLPLPLKLPTVAITFYIESKGAKIRSLIRKMFREREAGKFCFAAAVTIHLTMHN